MNPENMQLLNLIEDIDNAVYESEYCVLNAMYEDYYKLTQICEYTEDFDSSVQLIMEGSFSKTIKKAGKNVSKVLRKIWKMIKAAFNAMKKFVNRILHHTKDGLHSAKKTTNQILHDMKKSGKKLVRKTKKIFHEAAEPVNVNNQQQSVEIIEIPADDHSQPEYKHQRVRAISSSIFVKINDSGKPVISINTEDKGLFRMNNPNDIDDQRFIDHKRDKFTSHNFIKITLYSMKNKEMLFKFFNLIIDGCNLAFDIGKSATSHEDFIAKLKKSNYDQIFESVSKIEKQMETMMEGSLRAGPLNNTDIPNEIPVDTFIQFQKEMDNIIQKMEVIPRLCDVLYNIVSNNPSIEDQLQQLLSYTQGIADTLFKIQMSMNYIATAYDNIWIPDKEFFDTIDDYETLDMFVNEMIQNHIPQKAVMKSAWLCAVPSIKGDGDKYKPIWGMMRGCFIPPNDNFIYKIALSQRSIYDNKTEIEISKQAQSNKELQDIIARVISHTDNGAVNKMEKVYGIGADHHIISLGYFRKKLFDAGVNYNITDLHDANFGFRNKSPKNGETYSIEDQPVIVDYAYVDYKKHQDMNPDNGDELANAIMDSNYLRTLGSGSNSSNFSSSSNFSNSNSGYSNSGKSYTNNGSYTNNERND